MRLVELEKITRTGMRKPYQLETVGRNGDIHPEVLSQLDDRSWVFMQKASGWERTIYFVLLLRMKLEPRKGDARRKAS